MTLQDGRTASEHDCDRILYSDELRRLGGVTQVVAAGEMPLFHTRLTHTLKVQQLARRIAEHLTRDAAQVEILERIGGVDIGATEAAGLAHDLGHPPFGHVGEAALHQRCNAAGLDGFEGNAQTFRILTKLARGRSNSLGLDLSDRTLRGTIKYPWMRTGDHEDDRKWNAYATEVSEFERVRAGMEPGVRSIEAAIMDWADDVTYAIHDLEDFIRAGRVPIEALASDDRVELSNFTGRALPRLQEKWRSVQWDDVVQKFGDVVIAVFAQFGIYRGEAPDVAKLREACKYLINQYVSNVEVVDEAEPLKVPDEFRGEVELFKQLTWHYIIHDPSLATLQLGQQRLVEYLFDQLKDWVAAAESDGDLHRLPTRLRDLLTVTTTEIGKETYANKEVRQARAVADYIASLTEAQAENLGNRLRGSAGYSALDAWLAY